MITGIHHFAIATHDLDRLVEFYLSQFGGEILRTFAWEEGDAEFDARLGLTASAGRIVMMGFDGMRIEFFQFTTPGMKAHESAPLVSQPGYSHVAFQCDDCQAEYDRLLAGGMEFNAPPFKMPGGGIFTYGRDPDGNIVEILQVPPAA